METSRQKKKRKKKKKKKAEDKKKKKENHHWVSISNVTRPLLIWLNYQANKKGVGGVKRNRKDKSMWQHQSFCVNLSAGCELCSVDSTRHQRRSIHSLDNNNCSKWINYSKFNYSFIKIIQKLLQRLQLVTNLLIFKFRANTIYNKPAIEYNNNNNYHYWKWINDQK